MEHLFNSVVRVERMQLVVSDGVPEMTWAQAHDSDPMLDRMLAYLPCRLDLNFVRPGKDIPMAPVAGKAPDRMGLMFASPYAPVKAGDRIVTIDNEYGQQPVSGTFDIRVIPDEAIDFATAHHLEVQVTETNQALAGRWPDDDEEE